MRFLFYFLHFLLEHNDQNGESCLILSLDLHGQNLNPISRKVSQIEHNREWLQMCAGSRAAEARQKALSAENGAVA